MSVTISGVLTIFLIYMAVMLVATLAAHAMYTKRNRGKNK